MSIVRGKDAILYWRYNGLYKPIACMRSWTLTTDAALGETSTKKSGRWTTSRWLKNSWSIQCDGLQSFDMNYSVALLRKGQFAGRPIYISATATDGTFTETYQGFVLVTQVTSPSSYNTAYEYSIAATGDGELNITDEPFDPNDITQGGLLMIWPYDGIGDEWQTGAIPELVGMWVPTLARDGVVYRRIDNAATFDDTKKEFKFDDTTGEVTFNTSQPALTPGETVDIAYQEIN